MPERKNSMRTELMQMLEDTLAVCGQGFYLVHGRRVSLKLSPKEMRAARVFLPDEIAALKSGAALSPLPAGGQCTHGCENTDSFSLAGKRCRELGGLPAAEAAREVLVLNLANPVHPGGGVRRGARAQEEDLCRKSTLLLSLEGAEAAEYYRYNRALQTNMGSDAVVVTPRVEIFRDESGGLLDETVVTAVMTCAAPMICGGPEGLTDTQYQELVYRRICAGGSAARPSSGTGIWCSEPSAVGCSAATPKRFQICFTEHWRNFRSAGCGKTTFSAGSNLPFSPEETNSTTLGSSIAISETAISIGKPDKEDAIRSAVPRSRSPRLHSRGAYAFSDPDFRPGWDAEASEGNRGEVESNRGTVYFGRRKSNA